MCGIFGTVSSSLIIDKLLSGLDLLQYRGYDSYGLAVLSNNTINVKKTIGDHRTIRENFSDIDFDGKVGIAHSRWATHGSVNIFNSHPHLSNNDFAIVHNGIIENHNQLKLLLKEKYNFVSETDSEVIAHLINHNYSTNKNLLDAVKLTVAELKGSFSFAVVSVHDPDCIIAATNTSSLVIGSSSEANYISSDKNALLPFVNQTCRLNDNVICLLSDSDISVYDFNLNKVDYRFDTNDMQNAVVSKNHEEFFMLKEIKEQPDIIRNIIKHSFTTEDNVLVPKPDVFDAKTYDLLSQVESIQVVACGTSYHAGSVASYWYEEYLGLPCAAHISSEFIYRKTICPKNCLFIVLSQSGETADTISALNIADKNNYLAKLAVCNNRDSSIAFKSDIFYPMHAGVEVSVASTKCFISQLVSLLSIMYTIAKIKNIQHPYFANFCSNVHKLPFYVESVLNKNKELQQIANMLIDKKSVIFSGRKEQYPIAMEGALKLKEISYIHAEAYPLGEFKHGSLALIEEGMVVIVSIANNNIQNKVFSNIQEILSRNGTVFLFHDSEVNISMQHKNLHLFALPASDDVMFCVTSTIPYQLLAFYVSRLKGFNPDKPRNLAKSVTVE